MALIRCSKVQDREENKERFVAINGLGWPSHAKTTHDKHIEFATKTLIAYSPCPALEGTQYIHDMVERYFNNDWCLALRSFVLSPKNRWCPTWVASNYEIENEVIRGFPIESMPFLNAAVEQIRQIR